MREIRARIDAYFKLTISNVRDTVPKLIGQFLVRSSQNRLQYELYAQLTKSDRLANSLGEPERVAEERKCLLGTIETLSRAVKVLTRDPDIAGSAVGDEELYEALKSEQSYPTA